MYHHASHFIWTNGAVQDAAARKWFEKAECYARSAIIKLDEITAADLSISQLDSDADHNAILLCGHMPVVQSAIMRVPLDDARSNNAPVNVETVFRPTDADALIKAFCCLPKIGLAVLVETVSQCNTDCDEIARTREIFVCDKSLVRESISFRLELHDMGETQFSMAAKGPSRFLLAVHTPATIIEYRYSRKRTHWSKCAVLSWMRGN